MLTLADLEAARAAQQVQQHAPTWFVIWSLRHRRFEAWQCTDPNECRIVYANSATALWDLMQQAELDLWRTSPPAARRPPRRGRPSGPATPRGPENRTGGFPLSRAAARRSHLPCRRAPTPAGGGAQPGAARGAPTRKDLLRPSPAPEGRCWDPPAGVPFLSVSRET